VFDRFYQGQRTQQGIPVGTGLGLAITKEIIEGHQGTIQAESKFGGGASFLLTLPLFGVNAIFTLLLHPMVLEADRDSTPLSFLQAVFYDQRTKREVPLDREAWEGILYALQKMVRSVDHIIPFQDNKVCILSFINKKLVQEIGERIQVKLTQGAYLPRGTEVHFRTCTYSEDSLAKEDFLKECRISLKED
jgi:hypothetical protein